MRVTRALLATISSLLIINLAIYPATGNGVTSSYDGEAKSGRSIHPDCLDHPQPRLCTRVIEELTEELGRFNEAFNPPDLDQLATFYHEDAVLYVGSTGRFFRGRDEIRNEFFAPFVAAFDSATVDTSAFRFQVLRTPISSRL